MNAMVSDTTCYNRSMKNMEGQLQKSIIDYLKFIGCYAIKIPAGAAYSREGHYLSLAERGTPDLIISRNPILIDGYKVFPLAFCEVKVKGGYLSDAQIFRLRELNRLEHSWLVAESVDDVIKWLDSPKYHGDERYVSTVLDESRKFIPKPARRKTDKLSFATFHEFNRFVDKKENEK